jgi:hypothetical protein
MTEQKDGWGLPPIEKIYEAFSAIADDRVRMGDGFALVSSSDAAKEYKVKWNGEVYSSNDNASYWQGYMGYPVIAVLMLRGKLGFDKSIPVFFKGINWKKINAEHKNNYAEAAGFVLDKLSSEGIDTARIRDEAQNIYEQIKRLDIKRKRQQ